MPPPAGAAAAAAAAAAAKFTTGRLISSWHPTLNLSHPTPDTFTWNTLVCSLLSFPTLSLFRRMLRHGVRPDSYTFPFLLLLRPLPSLSPLHAHALRSGLLCHPVVLTSFLSSYSYSSVRDSVILFRELPNPDLPAYNSLLTSFLRAGYLWDARNLFDEMPQRNVVSWSSMIHGFVKHGDFKGALGLFRLMQKEADNDVVPNEFTLSSVLTACAWLGALEQGKWVHAYIRKCGVKVNAVLGTSLIEMYAKCGDVDRAMLVFVEMGEGQRDVMAWSAMVSGLAMHGRSGECIGLFEEMVASELRPTSVTFLGLLCACVHAGMVEEGAKYFEQMVGEYGVVPEIQHYGCMVDLYSRAGLLHKAWDTIRSMPMKPDVLIWGMLLSGSQMHGDVETCDAAIKQLVELEPENGAAYVLLSNIYAKRRKWHNVRLVRSIMERKGIKKAPGCSIIEVGGFVHEFFASDGSHPDAGAIYSNVIGRSEHERLVAGLGRRI